jgi:hypothetical protein
MVLVADWAIAEVGPLRGTQRAFLLVDSLRGQLL